MSHDTRACASRVCDELLPPNSRTDKRFCSKKCIKAEHYLANRDLYRSRGKDWYQANREDIRETWPARYAAKGEQIRARHREFYKENRERLVAYSAAWYADADNRERAAERDRLRRLTGVPAAVVRARRKAHPDAFRANEARRKARLLAASTVPFGPEELAQRLAFFGNACWMCRGPHEAIEHVKPLAKGGSHMLANIRPACRACNSRKRDRWFGVAELGRFMKP